MIDFGTVIRKTIKIDKCEEPKAEKCEEKKKKT